MTYLLCPACGKPTDRQRLTVLRPNDRYDARACEECSRKRREAMHARTDQYKGADELGLEGSSGDIPLLRRDTPHQQGRRVIRKGEEMS